MLARLANGLFAAGGAAALAQFPAFYRQYLQHLSGRLAQAREDLAPIVADAEQRRLSVHDYLDRAAREGGELTGTLVQGYRSTFDTLQSLERAYSALRAAGPLERPLAFVRHLEPRLAEATLAEFAPGLPLTPEGGGYALVGLVLGVALLWLLERPVVATARRRRARRAAVGAQPATGTRDEPRLRRSAPHDDRGDEQA